MATKENEKKGPVDEQKVREIINGIMAAEAEKAHYSSIIKDLKAEAVDAGLSKEQLSEALRLIKLDEETRNLILSGANICLKVLGRGQIDLTFMGPG